MNGLHVVPFEDSQRERGRTQCSASRWPGPSFARIGLEQRPRPVDHGLLDGNESSRPLRKRFDSGPRTVLPKCVGTQVLHARQFDSPMEIGHGKPIVEQPKGDRCIELALERFTGGVGLVPPNRFNECER